MKRLIIALVLGISTIAALANGRCQAPSRTDGADCRPPAAAFVPVLAYHRVIDSQPAGMTVISVRRFAEHIDAIKAAGYRTATIADLTQYMNGKVSLPPKTVVLTFDDGWRDQLNAADVLSAHGMTGTFFITSGHFSDELYMTEDDVARLSKVFEIGAHSHTHFPKFEAGKPNLTEMVGELVISKFSLSKIIGKQVTAYAWPYGYTTLEAVQYAERLGMTSASMINGQSKNVVGARPMEIERLNIDGRCTAAQLKQMLETGLLGECK